MIEDKRRERLRFRSWHRGTREMDLLLGSFADEHVPAFSQEQLDLYELLLEQADPDLYNWIIGSATVPPQFDNDVTQRLCKHSYAGRRTI